jgi:thiamine-phosphate pyrophosphorylase
MGQGMINDYSLYFVTGEDSSNGRSTIDVVMEVLAGGVDIIQMREKSLDKHTLLSLGKKLAALCREKNALFIVNDDPVLAKETGADGVHLGQEDLLKHSLDNTRQILGPEKCIGVSTHSVSQFALANDSDVDYIAYGPVFPTKTKEYHIGIEEVEKVLDIAVNPVVFIGGINMENIGLLLDKGAKNVAMIRAISQADNIMDRVMSLKKILNDKKRMAV